jgi:hypothetical protein
VGGSQTVIPRRGAGVYAGRSSSLARAPAAAGEDRDILGNPAAGVPLEALDSGTTSV